MRRVATPAIPALYTAAWLGDSQTDPWPQYGCPSYLMWPELVADGLRREGAYVQSRNFGVGGDTTTQALARADAMFMYDTPSLCGIYLGVNDPGASISQATTQANVQAIIKACKHGAKGPGAGLGSGVSVAGQASLPANGEFGQRYVVISDTSTTGGVAATHSAQAATITGTVAASGQAVWEYRNPQAGEYGWGRVAVAATAPTVCARIVVVSTNYLNFTTGGDTPNTPYSTYANVNAALAAAVAAENVTVSGVASVVYADLYALQKARIVAGTDPDFSSVAYDQTRSWHYTQNNQHHNSYGHWLVAQAVRGALPARWVTDLSTT